jgi:histone deacetylase 11
MDPVSTTTWPSPRLVYHRRYNIGLLGIERLHPFDSRKYGRAFKELWRQFGRHLNQFWVKPPRPVNRAELLTVHTDAYLPRLRDAKFVAGVVEVQPLRYLPGWATDRLVLRPMRWATMGTVVAAREAMDHGVAINLSGGYHHASPGNGHGFSAYADVGMALHDLRASGRLGNADKVVYVDLDAHQGNGVCRTFQDDPRVFIYDQYNRNIFPNDVQAQRRIDCDVPLPNGCHDRDYLGALRSRLPAFLDALAKRAVLRLAIYNAGTDIYANDRLGGLSVSRSGVVDRDRFVLHELISRHIPTVVLLSGGYSGESYRLVADMAGYVLRTWGGAHESVH